MHRYTGDIDYNNYNYFQLAAVVQLQLETAIRTRPRNLFDDKGRRAMFESLLSHPLLPMAKVDNEVRKARQSFCEQCMTSISDGDRNVRSIAIDLAREWQLDVDRMRVLEIRQLYQQVCKNIVIR